MPVAQPSFSQSEQQSRPALPPLPLVPSVSEGSQWPLGASNLASPESGISSMAATPASAVPAFPFPHKTQPESSQPVTVTTHSQENPTRRQVYTSTQRPLLIPTTEANLRRLAAIAAQRDLLVREGIAAPDRLTNMEQAHMVDDDDSSESTYLLDLNPEQDHDEQEQQ
jgi:hypothetical protein